MLRIHFVVVVSGALVACGQPGVIHPEPDRIDTYETYKIHEQAAKQQPPVSLEPKPRDDDGQVAGQPPPPSAAAAGGAARSYTQAADFDAGAYRNLSSASSGQLQLEDTITPFKFMWVSVSSKGTLVKIDTETGEVLGEYRSAPLGQPTDPSRTAVDSWGNVWVANRDGASVVHVGLVENHQCVDRNMNGRIDTSTGLGDVLDWPHAGRATPNGEVSTADDECIIHYTKVNSSGTRHVSVIDELVWVSGLGGRRFDLIDGSTGAIIRSEGTVGAGGYGGLIDANGVIWSARPLLRWDTDKRLTTSNARTYTHDSYGLCIDSQGHVWNTSLRGKEIREFAPDGTLLASYPHGADTAQGCAIDRNDHVWVAHSLLDGANTVGHLLPDGSLVGTVTVGAGPTAVAVDARGKIWATNYTSQTVSRIDPAAGPRGPDGDARVGAVDLTTVDLGGLPYNYGGMTGSMLYRTPTRGSWTVLHDSGIAGANWGAVDWRDKVVGDGSLEVSVASSDDGISFGAPQDASPGVDLSVADGRYLRVTVDFERASTGASPVLYEISVAVREQDPD